MRIIRTPGAGGECKHVAELVTEVMYSGRYWEVAGDFRLPLIVEKGVNFVFLTPVYDNAIVLSRII